MQSYQINQKRLVRNFLEFVQIPSETNFENNFMTHLLKVAHQNNFFAKIINNNLIIRIEGNESKPKLFFCAHLDTVAPGVGIKPIIKNEIIYSDGNTILGADNKAAIAVLFEVLFILKENKINSGEIELLLTSGEEQGFLGAKALQLDHLTSRNGYVLDSEGRVGGIEISSPGQLLIEINFLGQVTQNRIRTIYRKITHFFRDFCMKNGSTYSVFRFGLNQAHNYNVSILFKTNQKEAMLLIKDKLNILYTTLNWQNIDISFKIINQPHQLSEDNKLVTSFTDASSQINIPSYFIKNNSATDTNILAELGFNVANLAIGYEKIHTVEERIAISELVLLTKLILTLIITQQGDRGK